MGVPAIVAVVVIVVDGIGSVHVVLLMGGAELRNRR